MGVQFFTGLATLPNKYAPEIRQASWQFEAEMYTPPTYMPVVEVVARGTGGGSGSGRVL